MGCQKITYYQEGALVNFEKNLKVDYGKLGFTEKKGFNYYPFGALLPGRHGNSGSYRYGFNGQEKDDEVNGVTGSSYTAEYWQYDSRLGRRWNRDPVVKQHESSYATFANNPIYFVDPNGDTVDPSQLKGDDKSSLKSDLESKTGLSLKEVETDLGSEWQIDKSIKVNKEGTSGKARRALKKAIKSDEYISIVSGEYTGVEPGTNTIMWNKTGIERGMGDAVSEELDPTTNGFALTFFHEIGHTDYFRKTKGLVNSIPDPLYRRERRNPDDSSKWKFNPSSGAIERLPNGIRRQLGSSYGQRKHYLFNRKVGNILSFDKTSFKQIKKGIKPSTGAYIDYK